MRPGATTTTHNLQRQSPAWGGELGRVGPHAENMERAALLLLYDVTNKTSFDNTRDDECCGPESHYSRSPSPTLRMKESLDHPCTNTPSTGP
ncbi:unnamed protein product [Arctogadus glacialis]